MIRFAFVVVAFAHVLSPIYAQAEVTCALVSSAMGIASSLRGLSVEKDVVCAMKQRHEVEKYLRDTIDKKIPKKKIQAEETVYKMLGVIPSDFDYVNGVIKLYTDQLGGYYDPDTKEYAMAAWLPASMQTSIAVHELTHALQDQHFHLTSFISHENATTDELMARSALIEGDATAVMVDYARALQGLPSISKESSVSAFVIQNIAGAMLSSGLHSAPPALQSMLIFPYVSGLHFAHALLREGGYKKINASFKNPPSSTEQILHPEKYLKNELGKVTDKDLQKVIDDFYPEYQIDHADTLGEFFISTWASIWISPYEASSAARGWSGDRLILLKKEGSDQSVLILKTRWDSIQDKDEFLQALIRMISTRFSLKPEVINSEHVFQESDSIKARVTERENDVTVHFLR